MKRGSWKSLQGRRRIPRVLEAIRTVMKWFSLIHVAVIATALVSGPAGAAEPLDQIVGQLRAQGYQVKTVSRTWLGRIKVEAEGDGYQREVVFNRVTGEILRDYRSRMEGSQSNGNASSATTGSGESSNSGHGDDDSGKGNENRGGSGKSDDSGGGGRNGSSGSNSGSGGNSGGSGGGGGGSGNSGGSGSNSGSGGGSGGGHGGGHGSSGGHGSDDGGDDD